MVKKEYKKYTKAKVFIKLKGEIVGSTRSTKIVLKSPTRGTVVKDGRPVRKSKGRWIYEAR